ncbi:MAG: ATP-binding cassette domain-containing protein, partial [Chloroflexi bacterium]|nr:ATP-binding cassette domain-containing protein [Chloroflexota bacterium]
MAEQPKIEITNLTYRYGDHTALDNVSLNIAPRAVTALFGPAGGGKTTLLRLINRLNDTVEGTHRRGQILIDGQDIYAPGTDVPALRRRVGMVFALPLPLPMTIFENVTYGPRLRGIHGNRLAELAERSLRQAAIWDEVSDRLHTPAMALSGGQQQRVCLARVLALEPEVILLD